MCVTMSVITSKMIAEVILEDCGGYMGRLWRLYGKIVEVIWEDCGGYMCSTIARLPFLGGTLCRGLTNQFYRAECITVSGVFLS